MPLRRVNFERNDVGSAYDPRESKPAEKLRARDSDHLIQFRLAYRALLLVSRGASERDAVQRAAALDPRSTGVKRADKTNRAQSQSDCSDSSSSQARILLGNSTCHRPDSASLRFERFRESRA